MAWAKSIGPTLKTGFFTLAALCVGSGAAVALDWGRPLDQGGSIGARLREIAETKGQRHEIKGDCMSSCTLWLGHKGACVAADATLWFHAAADGLKQAHYTNPWLWKSTKGNRILLNAYPARLRAFVVDNGWLETPEMHTLSGAQLTALGVPACL